MKRAYWGARLLLGAATLAACVAVPSPDLRLQQAIDLAQSQGWQALELSSTPLHVQAFVPARISPNRHLTVYLEGDGFAWLTPQQPSNDPTPINPLALRLALAQPGGNAAYLARPCQYLNASQPACQQRYWTQARFSEEIVASLDQALNQLQAQFGASQLTLVGYSGGAALALQLAARRADIQTVISVAGNLDHHAWTTLKRVQPLSQSLPPVDPRALAYLPQWHLVGADDRVVPPELAEAFVARFTDRSQIHLRRLSGFDHHCCWAEAWPRLWPQLQAPEDASPQD